MKASNAVREAVAKPARKTRSDKGTNVGQPAAAAPETTQEAPASAQDATPALKEASPAQSALEAVNNLSVPAAATQPAKIKVQVMARVNDAPVTLEEVAVDISKNLASAATSLLRVGGLLHIAREFHASAPEFLTWTEKNFNLKKAQTYKLMKIHTELGGDTRFEGVAMRVLYMLTGQPAEVVTQAAELAQAGKLDTKAAEALTGKQASAQEPDAERIGTKSKTVEAEFKHVQPAQEGAQQAAPASTGEGQPATAAPAEAAPLTQEQRLMQQVEDLLAQVKEANARIMELTKPKSKAVQPMPMLHQFKDSNPALVLGLTDAEAKDVKQVRAAFREYAAIWSKEANAEAHELLTAAKDALLAQANK